MTETIFFESTLPLSHAFSSQKEHTVFQPSQLFAFRELPRHAHGSIFFFGNVFRRPLYNESTVQLLPPHSSGGFGLAHPIYKKLSQTFHDECRGHGIGIIFSKGAPNTAGFFSAANGRFKISSLRSFPRVIEFLLLLQVLSSAQMWRKGWNETLRKNIIQKAGKVEGKWWMLKENIT